jgi:hypothetical protein
MFLGLVVVFAIVAILALRSQQAPSKGIALSRLKPLTASRPSIVEGFPVPVQASLTTPTSSTTSAAYIVPATLGSLNAWYFNRLKVGQPWHEWLWVGESSTCNGHFSEFASVWQWEHQGVVLTLAVSQSNGFTSASICTARMGDFPPECAPT